MWKTALQSKVASKLSQAKTAFCTGAGFGVGAMVSFALIVAVQEWHSSLPQKQWNTTNLVAQFQRIDGWKEAMSPGQMTEARVSCPCTFVYSLTNKGVTDYNLREAADMVLMTSTGDGLKRTDGFSFSLPLFVPAGQTVALLLSAPEAYQGERSEGFVIFDKQQRYRIILPPPRVSPKQ